MRRIVPAIALFFLVGCRYHPDTVPLTGDRAEVSKKDITRREPSKLSPMPEGLVNVLTKDEIFDLVAYLESGGLATYAAFKK